MIKDDIDLIAEARKSEHSHSRRDFFKWLSGSEEYEEKESESGGCGCGSGCGCHSTEEEETLEVDLNVIDNFVLEQIETGGSYTPPETIEDSPSMGLNRRDFLKCSAAGAIATAVAAMNADPVLAKDGKIQYGMIIDIRRCMGDKACVVACKAENKTPPGVDYNVVWAQEFGEYPDVRKDFIFRPCLHCELPSCIYPCPTQATFKRPEDGIVVVDYDICIGCRYCIAACPYGARSFDYGHFYNEGNPSDWEKQPSPEYGENRSRVGKDSPIGTVRKCTFCMHRINKGLNPACAEACAPGAVHFGNIADPNGVCRLHGENLQELLRTRNYYRLKEELGNGPSVYYLT